MTGGRIVRCDCDTHQPLYDVMALIENATAIQRITDKLYPPGPNPHAYDQAINRLVTFQAICAVAEELT